MPNPLELPAWSELRAHQQAMRGESMRGLFAQDPERGERFRAEAAGLTLDYSKNIASQQTLSLLFQLARESGLAEWTERMFGGEAINSTEGRAVLHVALRGDPETPVLVDGVDVAPQVAAALDKMLDLAEKLRARELKGTTGEPITDLVLIGIGGSTYGAQLAAAALRPLWDGPVRLHFLSNVDGDHVRATLGSLPPASTLFIVSSKTFRTEETLAITQVAKSWLEEETAGRCEVADHFVAICADPEAPRQFGIRPEHVLESWDWVCGRFSLWGSLGLPVAAAVGPSGFRDFLRGAAEMDAHFRTAPLERNLPALLGLLGVWYINFFDWGQLAILPYSENLQLLPVYLQQLDMESNGKRVDRDGRPVAYRTGPIVFGERGTDCQHTFLQLMHQGTQIVPTDFIVARTDRSQLPELRQRLYANCLAQAEALMAGRSRDEVVEQLRAEGRSEAEVEQLAEHKVFEGNRPSNLIRFEELTPRTLGALIALYEHKIFVQGVIWNINSFDQWGVELAKALAREILNDLEA